MADCSGVTRGVAGLVCTAVLMGCVETTDSPPASSPPQPPAAGSIARNVILFIGDGMGVSTVTAARIFDGQSLGLRGEEHTLIFETFPHVALVKTYNTNQQVPDSAGTATAMMTGMKTRAGVINIGPDAQRQTSRGQFPKSVQAPCIRPSFPSSILESMDRWITAKPTVERTSRSMVSVSDRSESAALSNRI